MSGFRTDPNVFNTNGRVANIAGVQFGKLLAHEPVGRRGTYWVWLCECQCGMYCLLPVHQLTTGKRGSCEQYGCEPLETGERYKATRFLKRHPDTGDLIPAETSVAKYSKAAIKQPKPEHDFGDIRQLMYKRHRKEIATLKVGDVVRMTNSIVGAVGTEARILEISEQHFVVRRVVDGKVRRVLKRMVRTGYAVGGCDGKESKEELGGSIVVAHGSQPVPVEGTAGQRS